MDIKKMIDDLVASGVELDDLAEKLAEQNLPEEQLAEALAYIEQLKQDEKKKAFSLFGVE